MKCPNCKNQFEEKAGLLFCKDCGWHKLNEMQEIEPAEAPTDAQNAAWDKKAVAVEAEPVEEQQGGTAEVEAVPVPSVRVPAGNNTMFIMCMTAGVIIALLLIALIIRERNTRKRLYANPN